MKPFLTAVATALAVMALDGVAHAEPADAYPSGSVRLIVPSAAGGGADALGRLIAEELARRLGQTVVVENIAGAGGTSAIRQLAHAEPDGYTIALGTMTTTTMAPAVYARLPYDPVKDLTTLARVGTSPIVLIARNDVPANNLKELVALAKKSGTAIQFGSGGHGSTGHFCAEVLAQKTGVRLDHIPFEGAAPVVTAMLGDVVKVGLVDVGTGAAAVKTGKIKALAMCTRRTAKLPDVPNYREQGVDFDQWTGWAMYAPAGLPEPVANKISLAIRDMLQDRGVVEKMTGWGITPEYMPGKEHALRNARDIEVWKRIAKEANVRLE